ncbi:TPA: hypothetical protein ACMDO2_004473 [Vibrio parahaemolyticus]|nr:hypothetical protein [Vibrio parahaemolyticus]
MNVNKFETLSRALDEFGEEIESTKQRIQVIAPDCLDNVPTGQGVYWIETTMPIIELQRAISALHNKQKKLRVNPPVGATLIVQDEKNPVIIYSGTEGNIQNRLKQHLFYHGSKKTVKLGCIINQSPFCNYDWFVSFAEVDSYELRYAVESWWRLNKGWPQFCLR